jgi:subtilisin family serine protease
VKFDFEDPRRMAMSLNEHPVRTTRSNREKGAWSWWRVAGALAILLLAASSPARADEYTSGEIQIELAPGVPIGTINDRYSTTTADSLPPLYLLTVEPGQSELVVLQQMLVDPDIVAAELSWDNESPEATRGMVVIAVGGTVEGFLDQTLLTRLNLAEAHLHTKGDGVLIAIVDTGVFAEHPALEGTIAPGGIDFVDDDSDPTDAANGIDDDGDGETDEGAGHGTMVAGIAHLVAPNARILPIRVLNDEGVGKTFDLAKGIRYAVDQGADVINLSLGLSSDCWTIGHEIQHAHQMGVAMVGAAGNQSIETCLFPARENDVLGVTALDSVDVKADFANWESRVDLSAPGVGILAPYYDGEYAIGAGTSFAAPFVTGQTALILATNPDLPVDEAYAAARLGVDWIYWNPENYEYLNKLGTGRIDAYKTWYATPKAADVPGGALAGDSEGFAIAPNPVRSGVGTLILARSVEIGSGAGRLWVLDAAGRRIRSLAAGEGGVYRWDGRDGAGRTVAAGSYFVAGTARPGGQRAAARIVVLDP